MVFILAFNYLLWKLRFNNLIKIFLILIADINKMFKFKIRINPREKFPVKYYNFLNIFSRILAKR